MNITDARAEICRVGASLYARGLAHGSAGNISMRLADDDGYLITPTNACLGHLTPHALARVSAAGEHLSGDPASKTLALHRAIYDADPAARCVIHTHSHHTVRLSLQGVWTPQAVLPPITPYAVMLLGAVPLIPYHRPGDPLAAKLVAQAIQTHAVRGHTLRAVLMDRLGPNVWHQTPAAAMAALEELEETAKLWLNTHPKPEPLGAAQLEALHQQFGAVW
jgi:3-dehydro-4-phosphotetronate decarboxylase